MQPPNGSNGSNGHSNGHLHGHVVYTGEDKGERTIPPIPCALRTDDGGWCILPDKHEGSCSSIARRYGPEDSIWHRHRGQQRICGKVTGPGSVCMYQKGHGGPCK